MEIHKGVLVSISALLCVEYREHGCYGSGLALYTFEDEEELTIFNEDDSVFWKGVVSKIYLEDEEKWGYGNLTWYQKGFTPDEWKRLCERNPRAEMVVK